MIYQNPIIKGFHPDPSICFDGTNYYLVCSSFEYFPCLPIFKSQDLVNWKLNHYAITDETWLDFSGIKNSMGLFAPTIRYHDGTYFLVCTNISQGNFICHTENPEDGWSKPIWLDVPKGIDPSLTFINEKCFYQLSVFNATGQNQIMQLEINPFTGDALSEVKEISRGCGGRDVEAPHIFFKDEWYYLVLAEGGTREGHMVTIQRSKTIDGPYEGFAGNPVLSNRDIKSSLQAVGHADFFCDKFSNWWLVALATRPRKHFTLLGRETILLPVDWQDGWPIVNQDGHATEIVATEKLTAELTQSVANAFTADKLQTVRFPISYRFDENLTLTNYPNHLGETQTQAISFVSVSQEDVSSEFDVSLNLLELAEGAFGIAVYKDDDHLYRAGIKKSSAGYQLFCEKKVFDLQLQQATSLSLNGNEELIIRLTAAEFFYTIEVFNAGHNLIFTDQIATRHFSNEVANSPFTGVQLGVFAQGQMGTTTFINPQLIYK
ncbi:glycoside hydrolase family 43 protein [Enterococcus sp. HY326]|uniref:glycoside hydrolase family 43 protein n=1 Tax=Enterococcus sp. HY326 TaxID=2971265 RepID=UPI00223F6497|nr:glycoside hydrolase family 43 protein [Enterococcus sp. HY326]